MSRIAGTVYTATNTIILGFIDPTGGTAGYYTAAYKLISTGQSALSPIADSVYPYMVRNKDFSVIKKTLKFMMPIIIIGCVFFGIFAEPLCSLIFGKEFSETANILRAMLPAAILTLPDYLLGFPSLGAIGMSKHANYSIYLSAIIHILNLIVLLICGQLNVYTLAGLISVAMIIEVGYRGTIVFKYKKNFEKKI